MYFDTDDNSLTKDTLMMEIATMLAGSSTQVMFT
jgi:hypothetical protein